MIINSKVVSNTIAQDLDDINAKVQSSSLALRKERVGMIKVRRFTETNYELFFVLVEGQGDV